MKPNHAGWWWFVTEKGSVAKMVYNSDEGLFFMSSKSNRLDYKILVSETTDDQWAGEL